MQDHDNSFKNGVPVEMKTLFDNDLALTIKDRIMTPIYLEHSEEEITAFLKDAGFSEIQRLMRYPVLKNIRKYLSPLYYKYDSEFAKLLYGSGSIQVKAIKSGS